MRMRFIVLALTAAACGEPAGTPDAPVAPAPDAAAPEVDAAPVVPDAAPDATPPFPPAGFGAISGACGVLTPELLDDTMPEWFQGDLDFGADRYDDPADRPLLTDGGEEIILDGNAGGSSLYSEVFAYEWLARCEGAILLKTETEVVYDVVGKKTDLLVEIDGRKVGVSVTRAMTYPFGNPYTLDAATMLIERKLDDHHLATTYVSDADQSTTEMLAILAYDLQHAEVAMDAWNSLDAETRGATILVVVVTSGDDMFIYTDM